MTKKRNATLFILPLLLAGMTGLPSWIAGYKTLSTISTQIKEGHPR